MSGSLHSDGFHFIAATTFPPHQSEKSKPLGQAYYLPPLRASQSRLIRYDCRREQRWKDYSGNVSLFFFCIRFSVHQFVALFETGLPFFFFPLPVFPAFVQSNKKKKKGNNCSFMFYSWLISVSVYLSVPLANCLLAAMSQSNR